MGKLIIKHRNKLYEVGAIGYVYDGCHRHYLIRNDSERCEASGYFYNDFWNLATTWNSSCGLEFIDFWDVINIKSPLIPQCVDIDITYSKCGWAFIEALDPSKIDDCIEYMLENNLIWEFLESKER